MSNFVQNVPCSDLRLLLSFVWFYDEPNWPPTLWFKFEVDTFSQCIKIEENPQIFGSSPSLVPRPVFLWVWFCDGPRQIPSCVANLNSLASALAEILKGRTKIFESSPSPKLLPLFLWVWFYDGPWQTKLHTKFIVASVSRCRNIKGWL